MNDLCIVIDHEYQIVKCGNRV